MMNQTINVNVLWYWRDVLNESTKQSRVTSFNAALDMLTTNDNF